MSSFHSKIYHGYTNKLPLASFLALEYVTMHTTDDAILWVDGSSHYVCPSISQRLTHTYKLRLQACIHLIAEVSLIELSQRCGTVMTPVHEAL